MKTILVTGAAGGVGTFLREEFREKAQERAIRIGADVRNKKEVLEIIRMMTKS